MDIKISKEKDKKHIGWKEKKSINRIWMIINHSLIWFFFSTGGALLPSPETHLLS